MPMTLGLACGGACTNPFCLVVNPSCRGTSLSTPCVGRAAGMYCTRACTSDSDCAAASGNLSCLTSCGEHPELAGLCWRPADAEFLRREVCSAPTPDAGPGQLPPPDAAVATPDGGEDGPGAAPDGGAPADGGSGAVAKFCNRVRRNGAAVELTLELAGSVRLSAATDLCVPMLGQACADLPAGEATVRLLEGATVLVDDTAQIEAAGEYAFTAQLDLDDNMIYLDSDMFDPGTRCSATEPSAMSASRKQARQTRRYRPVSPR